MDAVVVACYAVLVVPTVVDAVDCGQVAGDRRCSPPLRWPCSCGAAVRWPLVAFIAVVEVAVTLLHPWGSNVSAGLWFSLYAVAVVHTRRFALVTMAVATAPLALLYFLAAVGPLERDSSRTHASPPRSSTSLTSIAGGHQHRTVQHHRHRASASRCGSGASTSRRSPRGRPGPPAWAPSTNATGSPGKCTTSWPTR